MDKDEKQSLHDTFDHILTTTQVAALEVLAIPGEVPHAHTPHDAAHTVHNTSTSNYATELPRECRVFIVLFLSYRKLSVLDGSGAPCAVSGLRLIRF